MPMNLTSVKARKFSTLVLTAFAVLLCSCQFAAATLLPVGPETADWSDMAFAGGVTGSYNNGSLLFTAAAGNSNDLELGSEYGPLGGSRHYGSGGTAGGAFAAVLSVTNVSIDEDPNDPARGLVSAGGLMTVTLTNSVAGSIGDDYGVANGSLLLTGTVIEALLDANGDDTLDVLVQLNGGALQTGTNSEVNLAGVQFSPANLAVLRFTKSGLPSTFATSFSLDGATLDLLGVPEPGTALLAALGALFTLAGRSKREL